MTEKNKQEEKFTQADGGVDKNESSEHYELIYLISNKFSEDELEPITSSVLKLIKDNGGEITLEENWGKKKLAYPIKKFFNAYYYLVEFNLRGEDLEKLDKYLRLSEEILRHIIVKKRIKTEEEIEEEKKIAKKIAERVEKEEQEKQEEGRNADISEQENKKPTKEDKQASMEDLDEKLDKILDETDNLL